MSQARAYRRGTVPHAEGGASNRAELGVRRRHLCPVPRLAIHASSRASRRNGARLGERWAATVFSEPDTRRAKGIPRQGPEPRGIAALSRVPRWMILQVDKDG